MSLLKAPIREKKKFHLDPFVGKVWKDFRGGQDEGRQEKFGIRRMGNGSWQRHVVEGMCVFNWKVIPDFYMTKKKEEEREGHL